MPSVLVYKSKYLWCSVIAMPDCKPFYAGTYFPKKELKQMLLYFIGLYKKILHA
jgi:uncharacterized protein YyaL (SSP411 family)